MSVAEEAPHGREPQVSRILRNKVPEVTIWFWVIKVLCTTVGESFADWINTTLGFGLGKTSIIFTVVLAAVLGWQMGLRKYSPFAYWSTVVVLSVTGTLYTDILIDNLKLPLAAISAVFTVALAAVFGVWYVRERTLSIHSILTGPREAFYWLAILVTFSLGTATGDWTLELTGWSPGRAVLLPTALIVAVVVGWRLGANIVLAFWLAYILTRPLGANMGDWLARPSAEGGLGLGTAVTSIIFLAAILGTVIYLAVSRRDVIEEHQEHQDIAAPPPRPGRERLLLGYFAAVAAATVGILTWANAQPHGVAVAIETEAAPAATTPATTPGTALGGAPVTTLAPKPATQAFPAADIAALRTIAQDTLAKVQAGSQAAAVKRVKDLETTWDADVPKLQHLDPAAWTALDGKIDLALKAVRAKTPDPVAEKDVLSALIAALA
ncbi:MAG: hypothetical protein M3256_12660 [Actinomycetota bacterium]|nr:hypothetical protein [Actinomycetota bacterium]